MSIGKNVINCILLPLSSLFFTPSLQASAAVVKTNYTPTVNLNTLSSYDEYEIRTTIVDIAQQYIGLKYKPAGKTPKGFDCSGFTYYLYKQYNRFLSPASRSQALQGKTIDLADVQTGDLVFFSRGKRSKRVGHVAMVVSNDENGVRIIHSTRRGIVVDNLTFSKYYKPRMLFAKNVISY